MVYNEIEIRSRSINLFFILYMSKTLVIILAVILIIGGWLVYQVQTGTLSDTSTGVAVSPYDFNASGCVGDEGDLVELDRLCPSDGGACDVLGETDPIQAALKFAEASNQYSCN